MTSHALCQQQATRLPRETRRQSGFLITLRHWCKFFLISVYIYQKGNSFINNNNNNRNNFYLCHHTAEADRAVTPLIPCLPHSASPWGQDTEPPNGPWRLCVTGHAAHRCTLWMGEWQNCTVKHFEWKSRKYILYIVYINTDHSHLGQCSWF